MHFKIGNKTGIVITTALTTAFSLVSVDAVFASWPRSTADLNIPGNCEYERDPYGRYSFKTSDSSVVLSHNVVEALLKGGPGNEVFMDRVSFNDTNLSFFQGICFEKTKGSNGYFSSSERKDGSQGVRVKEFGDRGNIITDRWFPKP